MLHPNVQVWVGTSVGMPMPREKKPSCLLGEARAVGIAFCADLPLSLEALVRNDPEVLTRRQEQGTRLASKRERILARR
jgi:hypothetical protein